MDGYVALLIARAGSVVPHDACEAEVHRLALATVLAEMFAFMGLAVLQVLRAAEAGGLTPDAALGRLRALAQRASAILLGLADAEPAEATLAALVQDLPNLA